MLLVCYHPDMLGKSVFGLQGLMNPVKSNETKLFRKIKFNYKINCISSKLFAHVYCSITII
jgi:hypothetical protein